MPFDGKMTLEPSAPEREPGCIRAVILYNPFDPNDRTIADIEWSAAKTVAEYLEGLPEDGVAWTVAAAGRVLEREEWDQVTLIEEDSIVLAVTPEKGGQGAMIMAALVLTVVTAGVGAWIAGGALAATGALGGLGLASAGIGSFAAGSISAGIAAGVATAAISIGGQLLMNALMPASAAKIAGNSGDETTSPSYQLNGPQSTARENVPVPIVYGEFRVGGNRINIYTQNADWDGKTQDVYLQYVVCDGEIDSISDLEINDQPLSSFRDVQWDWRPGTLGQPQSGWFIDVPVTYADGRVISQTPILYDTIDPVDRVQLDVSFPNGLFGIDQGKGTKFAGTVEFMAVATPIGGGTSVSLQGQRWDYAGIDGSGNVSVPGIAIRVLVAVIGANGTAPFNAYTTNVVITHTTDSSPAVGLNQTRTGQVANNYVAENNWSAGAELLVFEFSLNELNLIVERGFNVTVSGGTIHSIEVLRDTNLNITRKESGSFQITLDSGPLPRARYRISLQRLTAEAVSDYAQDRAVLGQVKEIQADPVRYNRSAYYALKVRLNEQLNSVPKTTVKVRGRKVNKYDTNGNVIIREWSNNPADISLDILLSTDSFRQMPASRIDFPWFARWRAFCAANSLFFNGVFDYQTNSWDALVQVMRVGRATPIVSGLKWSGVMEAPDVPVMMFGTQNMVKGSFRNSWLGRTGRANQVEGQYYDAANKYRQTSVFAMDSTALAAGNDLIQATINLIGVTDAVQAQKEVDLQLQINRLIVQGCSFSASMDAIGCTIGDIIYVQHDMPKWGWGDRVKTYNAGLGTVGIYNGLHPQSEGGALPAGDWRLLVLKPAVLRDTAQTTLSSGSQITINKAISTNVRITRIKIASSDYQVLDRANFAGTTVFVLDRAPGVANGTNVELWETDVMAEGTIAQPTAGTYTLTLTSWTHAFAVEAGDQVFIGRVDKFKKPFRVQKFGYDSEQTRTIECLEYVPEIYDPVGTNPDTDYSDLQAFPLHVGNLTADQTTEDIVGGGLRHFATCQWNSPLNDLRGHAGADVYVSVNTEPFVFHERVTVGRSTSRIEGVVDQTIRFKVIAFDTNNFFAPSTTAPIAAVTLGRRKRAPTTPTGLSAFGGIRLIALNWIRPVDEDIKMYEVFENTISDINTAYKIGESTTNAFTRQSLLPRETRYYWVRAVSYSDEFSGFAGPASAITDWLVASDIADGILDTAKFAASIAPVALPATAGELAALKSLDQIIFPQVQLIDPVTGQTLKAQVLYRWNGTAWVAVVDATEIQGLVESAQIAGLAASKVTGQLTDAQIAAVAAAKLTGTISGTQIANGAISTAKLAAGSVTAATIAADTITADKIAANAITAAELSAGAVTAAKIAAGTILASNIAAGAITAEKIASLSITSDKVAANSIIAGKIAAGAVSATQIAANEIRAYHLASETIITQAAQIGTAVITEAKIVDLEVGTLKIKNNAITSTSGNTSFPGNVQSGSASLIIGDPTYAAYYIVTASATGTVFYNVEGNPGEGTYNVPASGEVMLRRNGVDMIQAKQSAYWNGISPIVQQIYYLSPGFYTFEAAAYFPGGQVASVTITAMKVLK